MPEALKQLQNQFAQALTTPGEQPELYQQIQDSHFAADQLLQIYRNNFVLSLTEALEATFPVLKAMVGEEFFAQLAKAFIRQVPLEKAAIAEFGAALPEFMAQLDQLSDMPYLIDLARFEWLYSWRINRMPVALSFPYDALSQLSESDYDHLRFTLSPDLTLFESQWAIPELFQRVKPWLASQVQEEQASGDPMDGLDLNQPQNVVIVTIGLAEVDILALDDEGFAVLKHCHDDKPFSELDPEQSETYLQQAIAQGLISGFSIEGS